MEKESVSEEIEETCKSSDESPPNPNPSSKTRTVKTKVPEAEIHLFRRGKGPIEIFQSSLGGWDQNQLEVRDILEKYGFKSLFAFNTRSGRGVPIRFNPRNGRSLLSYADGAGIFLDGEPKDSLVKPITKILLGVAVIMLLITFLLKETPQWAKYSNFSGGNFPPWILACVVIVFTRMRKRTRNFLKKVLSDGIHVSYSFPEFQEILKRILISVSLALFIFVLGIIDNDVLSKLKIVYLFWVAKAMQVTIYEDSYLAA
ncbi:hypothetical protein HHK36_004130 [Tetracentron sinense]|uniref:Uncharacterized protein n=1 Tax=Tetracentron sinense TaxID=13715 RepID=A0A834ZQC3_TETSI|nr:hypothetical protein HHK36_004130 [Tetracentron sinense]